MICAFVLGGWQALGCHHTDSGAPQSGNDRPPLDESVVEVPALTESPTPPEPEPLPGTEAEPAKSICASPIRGLSYALAIPQGKTGTIELVLSDYTIDCHYWTDEFMDRCQIWRTRITLPAKIQKPGNYELGEQVAYLDRGVAVQGQGINAVAFHCSHPTMKLAGSIEITTFNAQTIRGSICNSRVDGSGPRADGLVDGTFVATRCPACNMTGEPCNSNKDCCAGNCGSGTCHS